MVRRLGAAVLACALLAALAPGQRTAAVDLVSSAVPWVDDPVDTADADAVTLADGLDAGEVTRDEEVAAGEPAAEAGSGGAGPPPRDPIDLEDEHDHSDEPTGAFTTDDDLPIPPLAPGVGTLSEPVARPANSSGPHWVPFKGNRILWCVYRGAGRCNGHHPYPAIDVDMAPGTPIYAAGPGRVYEACNRGDACGGYGNHVRIRHFNNVRSIYGHFTRVTVSAGQNVGTGDLIGYSGCTGRCNGAHLHYEERNAAEDSIQIGQMKGYSGQRVVTYPNVWGYSAWTGIPPDVLRIRNDFFPDDDRDGDGTFDKDENCLTMPGPTSNEGCPIPRYGPSNSDAAVRDGVGNLRHHVVDETGRLWVLTKFARGWEWVDRGAPPAGLQLVDVVAARAGDGLAWVIGADNNGVLWAGREQQSRWVWTEVGSQGGGFVGTPAATARTGGSIEIHAVATDGSLWRAVFDETVGWSWTDLAPGTDFTGSTPVSFRDGNNVVNTAIIDSAGRLHRLAHGAGGGDSVTVETGPAGTLARQRPALVADAAGLPSIFVLSESGQLWRFLKSYAGSWVWISHGAVPGGNGGRAVTAWRDGSLDLHVQVVDGTGRLRMNTQVSTLAFTWSDLGTRGPLAGLGNPSVAVDADGNGHVLVRSGGDVHEAVAEAGASWTVRPTGGPVLG